MPAPRGVFWWSFYDSADLDQFFEELLRFLISGKFDPQRINSAYMRAQVAGAMLGQRVLFVLDGFEVMQHEGEYQYGLVKNRDLLSFLEYMADPTRHQSFCVITSRVPVYQLASYSTYTQYTVGGLDVDAGLHLLRTRGVRGSDEELARLVRDWEGHPLTLELIADYLARYFAGDVTRAGNIPPPSAQESPYERAKRVLSWYDECLSDAERSFLTCFSAFRVPVRQAAIERVFRSPGAETLALASSVVALDRESFNALFERLLDAQIVQRRTELATVTYSSHPLVRDFYARRLQQENPEQVKSLHSMIKEYYVAAGTGASIKQNPSLRDFAPLFEVVHHACQAGAFDEGYRVYREEIERSTRESTGRMLAYKLGAYTQDLDLMREFFADSDFTTEPQVSSAEQKGYVLNEVGLCLMAQGRLTEALPLLERSIMVATASNDWEAASKSRQNVTEIYIHLGRLQEASHAAEEAVSWIPEGEFLYRKWRGLSYQAWSAHLQGELSHSDSLFRLAFEALSSYEPNTKYLYDLWGVWHAEHLRRTGRPEEALRITEENARVTRDDAELVSQCHRVLGDLYADKGDHHRAQSHYDDAVRVARNITHEQVLIESLLGRGGWAARRRDVRAADDDLSEALEHALTGGYRIYEIDIQIAQAWCRLADGDATAATETARRTRTASENVGYFWGQQDSDAVLASARDSGAR